MKTVLGTVISLFMIAVCPPAFGGSISGKIRLDAGKNAADVVVYVQSIKGSYSPPSKRPSMDHVDQKFVPTVLPVLRGQTVDFPNSDNVFHSAFSISESNPFDLGIYGPGREKFVTFSNPGTVEIFCHIHDHMFGYVLVLDNPYFDKAEEDGSYQISDLPPGNYEITAWVNPKLHKTQKVSVKGDETVKLDIAVQGKN